MSNNNNNNNNNNNRARFSGNQRFNRSINQNSQLSELTKQIVELTKLANTQGKYTKDMAMQDFKERKGHYDKADKINRQLQPKKKVLDNKLGQKILREALAQLKAGGLEVTNAESKVLEMLLIADDWYDNLKSGVQAIAPHVMPFVKSAVQMYSPVAYNTISAFTDSFVKNDADGETVRLKKRWLLSPANVSVSNQVRGIICSPSRTAFGKWLSTIARAYQYYKLHNMHIEFVPTVAVTTTGQISYFLDLDLRSDIATAEEIPQQYKAQSHAFYQGSKIQFSMEELQKQYKRYRVANDKQDTGPAQEEYDFAALYFTLSTAASGTIGNFYVEADLEFSIPSYRANHFIDQVFYPGLDTVVSSVNNPASTCKLFQQCMTKTGEQRLIGYNGGTNNILMDAYVASTQLQVTFQSSTYFSSSSGVSPVYLWVSSTLSGTVTQLAISDTWTAVQGSNLSIYVQQIVTITPGLYYWIAPASQVNFAGGASIPYVVPVDSFVTVTEGSPQFMSQSLQQVPITQKQIQQLVKEQFRQEYKQQIDDESEILSVNSRNRRH